MNNEPLYGNNIEVLSAEIHRLQNEIRQLQARVMQQKYDYCVERERIIASIGYRATFAAMALQGLLSNDRIGVQLNDGAGETLATGAVRMADALVAALAVPK